MDRDYSDDRAQRGQTAAQASIALIIAFVVATGLNYAFNILMSWLLPIERYGMFGVVQTILLLGGTIVGAGFPWALTRAISRCGAPRTYVGSMRAALLGNLMVGLSLGGA